MYFFNKLCGETRLNYAWNFTFYNFFVRSGGSNRWENQLSEEYYNNNITALSLDSKEISVSSLKQLEVLTYVVLLTFSLIYKPVSSLIHLTSCFFNTQSSFLFLYK